MKKEELQKMTRRRFLESAAVVGRRRRPLKEKQGK